MPARRRWRAPRARFSVCGVSVSPLLCSIDTYVCFRCCARRRACTGSECPQQRAHRSWASRPHTHARARAHTHKHTQTHIHTHTHTHTHTNAAGPTTTPVPVVRDLAAPEEVVHLSQIAARTHTRTRTVDVERARSGAHPACFNSTRQADPHTQPHASDTPRTHTGAWQESTPRRHAHAAARGPHSIFSTSIQNTVPVEPQFW
jgi:hypothetical protein